MIIPNSKKKENIFVHNKKKIYVISKKKKERKTE